MKPTEMEAKILELETRLASVEAALQKVSERRGPKSDREMTDEDARRIIVGDLASASHKAAAEALGLSYAQVYSCRKEFTFKHIHKEIRTTQKA